MQKQDFLHNLFGIGINTYEFKLDIYSTSAAYDYLVSSIMIAARLFPLTTLAVFLVQVLGLVQSLPDSWDQDLILSGNQKSKLDKFRDLVIHRLPHEYMKEEIYLVRWLRAKNFNIRAAEELLLRNLQWRKEQKIDTILQEDWTDFDRQFVHEVQGCDKQGRPVTTVPVGDWDVRKAVIAGHSQRLMRYFDKIFEEISVYVRQAHEHGANVTQYRLVMEMSRYNLVMQACPLCVSVYIYFFQSYENHFPGTCHSTTVVNMPQIFVALWEILRPLLSQQTRDTIFFFGKDKSQWQSYLLKTIDPRQLTREFGGVREEPYGIDELTKSGYFQCPKTN